MNSTLFNLLTFSFRNTIFFCLLSVLKEVSVFLILEVFDLVINIGGCAGRFESGYFSHTNFLDVEVNRNFPHR